MLGAFISGSHPDFPLWVTSTVTGSWLPRFPGSVRLQTDTGPYRIGRSGTGMTRDESGCGWELILSFNRKGASPVFWVSYLSLESRCLPDSLALHRQEDLREVLCFPPGGRRLWQASADILYWRYSCRLFCLLFE